MEPAKRKTIRSAEHTTAKTQQQQLQQQQQQQLKLQDVSFDLCLGLALPSPWAGNGGNQVERIERGARVPDPVPSASPPRSCWRRLIGRRTNLRLARFHQPASQPAG